MAPIVYTAFVIGGIAGLALGAWIASWMQPLFRNSLLEENRKKRIIAEQEFRHMCLIRTGHVEPEDQYEEYIRDCNIRKFAQRCKGLFLSYDQDLRAQRVFHSIMQGATEFQRIGDEGNPEMEARVFYYDK